VTTDNSGTSTAMDSQPMGENGQEQKMVFACSLFTYEKKTHFRLRIREDRCPESVGL